MKELLPSLAPNYLPQPRGIAALSGAVPDANERVMTFQLFRRDGSFRLASADAPDAPLAAGIAGFSDNRIDGIRWRVFGVGDPKHALILYAGEHHAVREALAWHLVEGLMFPTTIAIPALLLLMWVASSKGLSPLTLLVSEVEKRDPGDLRPVTSAQVPDEVQPLLAALNSLFRRLERALECARHFTGNAAHELRTPLAALRVQAQVAQRATNDEQRRRALDQISAAAGHAGHLVDQLLTLSRLDTRDSVPTDGVVRLLEIARRTARDLEPLMTERSVSLQIEAGLKTP